MSTAIREALAGSMWSRGQDFMGKGLALLAIRLLVSVNLLYAAIFLKFAAVPDSVALFTRNVASGPRVGISAGVPARVRGVRDRRSGSAPDTENS